MSSPSKDLTIPAWPDDRGGGGSPEKVVFALLLLLLAALAGAIFLGAIGALSLAHSLPYGAELEKVVYFASLPSPMGRVLAAAASGLIGLLSFVVLFRRLTSSRAPQARHVLLSDERGYVFVEKRGISTVAVVAIKRVYGVVDADVDVIGGGAAPVRLAIRVGIHAGAELTTTGEKVRGVAIDAVEKLVGLDVHDVLVKVEVIPLEDLDRLVQ